MKTHHIEKLLGFCDRHYFARFFVNNRSQKFWKFGPPGELLKSNIYQEWVLAGLIRTENIFPFSSRLASGSSITELKEAYLHAKFMTSGQLPFGISVQTSEVCVSDTENCELENNDHQTVLRSYLFVNPEKSTQYFDEWQQSQKVWWRKISACPGRFSLSDVQNRENTSEVQVLAEFPWGKRSVETVSLNTSDIFSSLDSNSKEVFETKSGRKKILPYVLISSVSLENAVLTFLCDAYDEIKCMNLFREVMRFHRKIAPYKTNFAISSTSTSGCTELCDLAQFLAKQLRNVGISTLLLPDASKKSLDSQFVRNDELGIPFTVVMNDSTLKNGIIGLRSRDTTLKEQVHITDLRKYMLQLFQNY